MKILLAPDSFKDALPALAACQALHRGIQKAMPGTPTILFPLADGGEGTAEILQFHLGGELISAEVADPLFRPILAKYLLAGDVAFIEMAQASGLQLLSPEERNPLETSTYGTGQLILDACFRGAKKIVLAIGGSATNDAGMGMAAALGWRFFGKNGEALLPVGKNISEVANVGRVQNPADVERLGKTKNVGRVQNPADVVCKVVVLCDVDNPLFGKTGAAQSYARQKGADEQAVTLLDDGLRHFSGILKKHFGKDFSHVPGAGAAGGLGAGAMAFLGATLRPGSEAMLDLTRFDEKLKTAALVITGEGRLDGQTAHGKLIHGVCQRAAKFGVPVVAFCGAVQASEAEIKAVGLQAAIAISPENQPLAAALAATETQLERAVGEQIMVILKITMI